MFCGCSGHCQRLEPEYKAAAALLAEEGIQLGKVDATEETELAERFEVQGYPTLKIFRKGQAAEYRGPRETDGIVSYMKKQAGPAVKTLEGTAVQDFALQDKELRFVVLGFFETGEDSARASLRATGDELREEISFGEVVGESAEAALQDLLRAAKLEPDSVRLPAILAVHTIGSIPSAPKFSVTVYEGTPKHDSEALSAWVKSVILPPVGEASPQSTRMYFEKGLPVAKLFVPVDWEMEANAKMARYYLVRFQKALKGFEDRILGALVDMNQVSAVWELSEMDVEPDSAEYYLLIDEPKTQKRYLFPDNTKTWNAEGVRGFIQKYLDGGLTPFIRSEPEPTEEEIAEDPVRKVVGTNFEKIVFNSEGKSVLLEIFAPWCGHCQALEPKYKAAAEELAEHQDKVILAKLDATANDFPQEIFEVQGVPSIFWIQGGNPDKVEKYEGERETSDLVDFVKSKAGLD